MNLALTERWPRRALTFAAAAFAVVLVVAIVDYNVAASSLPDLDPDAISVADDPAFDEREDIRDSFATRAYVYAGLLVAITLGLLAYSLPRVARDRRRELFTDVGVLGVALGGTALLVESRELTLMADGNAGGASAIPPVTMLVTAVVGSLVVSVGPTRQESTPMPGVSKAALALTALTIALVALGGNGRECGESAPGASDELLMLAVWAGVAAGVCGVISLFRRRWVVALVSIPMPVVGLIAVLAAACLE